MLCPHTFPFFVCFDFSPQCGSVCDRVLYAHHCEGHKAFGAPFFCPSPYRSNPIPPLVILRVYFYSPSYCSPFLLLPWFSSASLSTFIFLCYICFPLSFYVCVSTSFSSVFQQKLFTLFSFFMFSSCFHHFSLFLFSFFPISIFSTSSFIFATCSGVPQNMEFTAQTLISQLSAFLFHLQSRQNLSHGPCGTWTCDVGRGISWWCLVLWVRRVWCVVVWVLNLLMRRVLPRELMTSWNPSYGS